jgi:hypothetical protein
MKIGIARVALLVLAATLMAASAHAQGTGGGRKHAQQKTDTTQKPKADDKAYNAAIKGLPDKQYDPWHGVR